MNNISNTSALDYSSNVGIGFTFLPKLNVTLSNSNLTINNLVPGDNAVDSNTIAVNVSTNIAEGYNLFATVGSDNNTNNGYNTTNLVNAVDNNYTFSSLLSNISELSSFTNNTWGYSYSLDSGTTWISGDYNNASTGYNGLPLYTNTGIKLVEKADSTNSTVNFKIAAKASSTQPSGEYANVINFTVVSNTIPTTMLDAFIASGAETYNGYFKMQDMTPAICRSIDTDGEKGMQLIDVRDDKVYWVAKLKDNNCWMTQNLDLDLSHEVALTSETSDIDPSTYGTGVYTQANGYSIDGNGVVSWLPSTIDGEGIQRADTIDMVWSSNTAATVPGWTNDNNKPYSADAGDRYRYTDDSGNETVYTSFDACLTGTNNDKAGCQHTHLGNYYNWVAAVASNNTNGYNSGTPTNSICPKNWDLPANGKYGTMLQAQKIWTTNANYNTDGYLKIRISPLYFIRSGSIYFNNALTYFGSSGFYRVSTISYEAHSYYLEFFAGGIGVNSVGRSNDYGFSVRCLAR